MELSETQQKELIYACKHSPQGYVRVRALALLNLAQGWSQEQVAKIFQVSRQIGIPMETSVSNRGDSRVEGASRSRSEIEGEPGRGRELYTAVSTWVWFEPNSLDIASFG